MGLYIFISNEDRITKRKVSDEAVNEEFQEALKCDPSLMIEESYRIQKKGLFGKKEKIALYQIYHEAPAHDKSAYQARYQFSGSGEKNVVIAYLHGIINGYHHRFPV